jgi:hypothetical protein
MRSFVYLLAMLAGAAFFLAIIGLVGSIDYADALAEEVLYCEMVEAGHWPDYKELGHKYCAEMLAGKWELNR